MAKVFRTSEGFSSWTFPRADGFLGRSQAESFGVPIDIDMAATEDQSRDPAIVRRVGVVL